MTKFVKKLSADRSGATAIEYGLIAAFVSLAMVVALPGIKSNLGGTYNNVSSSLTTTAPSA